MNDRFLFANTDIASLAAFRILMGVLMAAEGFGAILTGWVSATYVTPEYTFPFIGFSFLHILVGPQAYVIYALLGILGLGIALGYRYQVCIVTYSILWSAVYFGQKISYNNHYYLLMLFSWLMCFLPCDRYASLDLTQGRATGSQSTPYWTIWIFKITLLIVYTYAAIAKIYPDWLEGKPIEIFLSGKRDWPLLGTVVDDHWFILLLSYGGIVFDLFIIPALWFKSTRKIAFGVSILFHLFNSVVFQIGIFPYMMLIATVLFFPPSYIRKLFFRSQIPSPVRACELKPKTNMRYLIYPFLFLMIVLPLRHFAIPGNVHWTEEGHRLSWHMMLRSKRGFITFRVKDARANINELIHPSSTLSAKAARQLATRPDMVWQYVQRLKLQYEPAGTFSGEIYAIGGVSLNGKPERPLIDPTFNMALAKWSHVRHNEWILTYAEQ